MSDVFIRAMDDRHANKDTHDAIFHCSGATREEQEAGASTT